MTKQCHIARQGYVIEDNRVAAFEQNGLQREYIDIRQFFQHIP
ncbi:hypothetical protein ALP10_200219 [Pseudomonas syringae pv. helianthi]|uniref:Uncharacterized protein n=1 Tax=Pseudomonas syringae pv. helianthi TaxID=251654 RepID=A0A3M6CPZ2_9PSED|nr:hypothetical protein ALP10_200219 [Pseudomonas syringae pv. helianthi]